VETVVETAAEMAAETAVVMVAETAAVTAEMAETVEMVAVTAEMAETVEMVAVTAEMAETVEMVAVTAVETPSLIGSQGILSPPLKNASLPGRSASCVAGGPDAGQEPDIRRKIPARALGFSRGMA
jgi:Na+-translocating ferredoxin:NAD+ oxidoreductase RnfA subunit